MMGGRGLVAAEDIHYGGDRGQGACAVSRTRGGIREFDSDAVLRDRHRRDGELVIVQSGTIDGPALVRDQHIGVEDQLSAHGSPPSVSRASASAMPSAK